LPCVIDIVKGDAVERAEKFSRGVRFQNAAHALLQGAMFFLEQGEIGAPGGFRGPPFFRSREEIASLQDKRTALCPFDPAAHRIFPIRGVKREFPDIVTPVSRPPSRVFRTDAFQRLPQIGLMPRGSCESLRKHREKQLILSITVSPRTSPRFQ